MPSLSPIQQVELQGLDSGFGQGGPGTLAATSTSSSIGQDAINMVQSQYPNLAWMLTVPELAPLIVQWAQSGTDPTSAEAQFESTQWYQQKSDAVRSYIQNVFTDPGQVAADIGAQQSAIGATLTALGLQPTTQQLTLLAESSLAQGWTEQQIKQEIAQSITPNADGTFQFTFGGISTPVNTAGTLQSDVQSVQAEAAKYLVPVSQSTLDSFSLALAQGTMDPAGVTAYLENQAQSLYPSIAGAIKAGITPADYVTPYKEVAAQLLGISPNAVDMTQSKWNRALSTPGPGGQPTAMSLYDWQQLLMQDPQYGYTNSVNAKDRASSLAQGLGEMFGKSASGPAGSTAFTAAGAPAIAGVPIT
jgi:hypothetical protein